MAAKSARIHTADRRYPFALQVLQTASGRVYFDQIDLLDNNRRNTFIAVKAKSARKLAQWILDNVEE